MAAQLEKPRDVVGGLLIVAIGAGFLLLGSDLPTGTSRRMGAGYFPSMLSWLTVALGAVIAALALLRGSAVSGSVGRLPWRGIVLIIAAVVFFGETLRGIGLAPALFVVVLATAWASAYASLRASIPLAVGLAAFCLLLFIRGLGLPLPVVGPWLTFSGSAPVADPAAPDPAAPSPPAETAPAAPEPAPAVTPPSAPPDAPPVENNAPAPGQGGSEPAPVPPSPAEAAPTDPPPRGMSPADAPPAPPVDASPPEAPPAGSTPAQQQPQQ